MEFLMLVAHLPCIIFIAFPRKQWQGQRASVLRMPVLLQVATEV
jgi:hypothetical protein